MNFDRSRHIGTFLCALAWAALVPSEFAIGQTAAVNLDDGPPPPSSNETRSATPAQSASSVRTAALAPSAASRGISRDASALGRRSHAASSLPRDQAAKRDELDPNLTISVKDSPSPAADLPGVLKLDGTAVGLLDPARARRVSCTNEGSTTVYLSVTEPNRIQLPFPNPHVISTTDLEISKRPNNNNIYVTFAAGVTHPATIWLEPQEGSSVACGLQVIPKRIPAQSIHLVDDSGATAPKAARAEEGSDFLSRVQAVLEDALEGRAPAGWSSVNVPVPPIAIDGVLIEGVRRLSSLREDIYVYTVVNPGPTDVILEETEFDGPTVEAVSILPTPLLHSRGTTRVAVLARKSATPSEASAGQVAVGAR